MAETNEQEEEMRRWRKSVEEVRAIAKRQWEAVKAGKEPDHAELPDAVERMPSLGLKEELESLAGV